MSEGGCPYFPRNAIDGREERQNLNEGESPKNWKNEKSNQLKEA